METLGVRALLFTDIEGSTALLQRTGDRYPDLLDAHHRIIRRAISASGGREVLSSGDALVAIFDRPDDAVAAALQSQLALRRHRWPAGGEVRVRMGIHVGEIGRSESGLVGMALHEGARIAEAGHGGQVLVSEAASTAIDEDHPWEPGLELRRLGEFELKDVGRMALVQLVHPDLPASFPPLRAGGLGGTNLPKHLADIVGREREVAEVGRLISDHRLVSLLGSGGVGKTRLAIAVATEALVSFPGGVWLVELADLVDPGEVPSSVAATLGFGGATDPLEVLRSHFRTRRAVIVLDNCEHVLAACAMLVAELTRGCPDLHVLTTTQEPLGLVGELSWRVPSLPSSDAVELFRRRLALVRAGYEPNAAELATVRRICEHLDGIPLAIELAAARCRTLSVDDVERRLADRFRLLRSGDASAPARHQTLLATVDWSYGLLEPAAQALARRMSVFRGGADLEAAEAVCSDATVPADDVVDLVDALHAKSLLHVEVVEGRTRAHFLETIRQYGLRSLTEAGEAEALAEQHARYFSALMRAAAAGWRQPSRLQWLQRCHAEAENFAVACDWLEHHDADAAASLLGDAHVWLTAVDDPTWLDRVRRLTERTDLSPDRQAVVSAVRALLAEGYGREDGDIGHRYAHRALAGLATIRDPHERLTVLVHIALGLRSRERAKAAEVSDQAIAEARRLGDDQAIAAALYDLILVRPEDDPTTRVLRAELIRLLDEQGPLWWGITPLVDEALDAHQHGRGRHALQALDRAEMILATVDRAAAVFTDEAVTFAVWNSLVRAEQGDPDAAILFAADTLAHIGDSSPHQTKLLLSTHGQALLLAGRRAEARAAFERAMDRPEGARYLAHAIAAVGLASLELDEARPSAARSLLDPIVTDTERQPWLRARAFDLLARAALLQGDGAAATGHVEMADRLYANGGYVVPPALQDAHDALRRHLVVA